jgi:hypothetical protein
MLIYRTTRTQVLTNTRENKSAAIWYVGRLGELWKYTIGLQQESSSAYLHSANNRILDPQCLVDGHESMTTSISPVVLVDRLNGASSLATLVRSR